MRSNTQPNLPAQITLIKYLFDNDNMWYYFSMNDLDKTYKPTFR